MIPRPRDRPGGALGNNAGIMDSMSAPADVSDAEWERVIRAEAVCPGGTATGITGDADRTAHGPAALGPHFVSLGRVPRPEEQAAVILFLASDAASNINGAILPADDGWSAA